VVVLDEAGRDVDVVVGPVVAVVAVVAVPPRVVVVRPVGVVVVVVWPVGVRDTLPPEALLQEPTTLLEPCRVVDVFDEVVAEPALACRLVAAPGQGAPLARGDTPRSVRDGGGRYPVSGGATVDTPEPAVWEANHLDVHGRESRRLRRQATKLCDSPWTMFMVTATPRPSSILKRSAFPRRESPSSWPASRYTPMGSCKGMLGR
jgi:hypothetical protein